MALTRRSGARFEAAVWPGFVDAMTALLLVLIFVLSIFMVIQFVLRDLVSGKDEELDNLTRQLADIAQVLSLEQDRGDSLEAEAMALAATLDSQLDEADRMRGLIASVSEERDAATARNAEFESRVASLLSDVDAARRQAGSLAGDLERVTAELDEETRRAEAAGVDLEAARASIATLEAAQAQEISEKQALQLALARLREEIDAQAEAARLAAAQRAVLEGMVAEMRAGAAESETTIADLLREMNVRDEALSEREAELRDLAGRTQGQSVRIDDLMAVAAERDAALAALEEALGGREAEIGRLLAEARAQQVQIASLETRRAAQAAEIARLADNAERSAVATADLQRSLDAARDRETAQAEVAAGLENEVERLNAARAAQEALARQLSRDLDSEREIVLQLRVTEEEKDDLLLALQEKLSDEERQRALEAAAAVELRDRLENADAELTAMSLALEEKRREAEDTLTLLAAAEAARDELAGDRTTEQRDLEAARAALTERDALLALARSRLSETEAQAIEAARQVALLNQQATQMRRQLGGLQDALDASSAETDELSETLSIRGDELNVALARAAQAERRQREEAERARELAEREAERLKAENASLAGRRSEFFSRISAAIGEREGVRVVGDRFVFSSEVLFAPGSAELGAGGREALNQLSELFDEVRDTLPEDLPWVLRVDGHTDDRPLSGGGRYRDNWALSQARALSVVRYLSDVRGFPADRLAATGFGEFQPVDPQDSDEARARNRRIELKLTER